MAILRSNPRVVAALQPWAEISERLRRRWNRGRSRLRFKLMHYRKFESPVLPQNKIYSYGDSPVCESSHLTV